MTLFLPVAMPALCVGAVAAAIVVPASALAGPLAPATPDPLPIVGGETVEPGAFPETVALLATGRFCSGVAVAPNLILTAAHCVSNLPDWASVSVHWGDAVDGSAETQATVFGVHPGYTGDPAADDIYDYAYVVTDPALPDLPGPYAVPITNQADWDFAMQWDRAVTIVGYGLDSADGTMGAKRKVDVTIDGFSELGLEFFAGGDGHDSCDGDSGGPVFVTLPDGTRALAGLVSRGPATCGDHGVNASAHPALCWVRDETGVDVTGDCSSCDCIDTTPPPEPEAGCGRCSTDHRPGSTAWWLVLVIFAIRRPTPAAPEMPVADGRPSGP